MDYICPHPLIKGKRMKVLIIGKGEVGSAIYEIIKNFHEVHIRDIEGYQLDEVEILHICYPDFVNFVDITRGYIKQYKPRVTIINSSVRIGTTELVGGDVAYVPVRGRHPNLSKEIPIYKQFVGANDDEVVNFVSQYYESCGMSVYRVYNSKSVELIKVLSNVHMGLEIAWRQEVDRVFSDFNVSSSVYESWEDDYNRGYRILGQDQLMRPRMKSDPIGGHCILECTKILKSQFPSVIFDFILESNEQVKAIRRRHGASDRKQEQEETEVCR